MQKLVWFNLCILLLGCGDDDDVLFPPAVRPPSLDARVARPTMDAEAPSSPGGDAGTACPPIAVCSAGKPGLLYNVCPLGPSSGSSAGPTCLVDPNGSLYLASLAGGQTVSKLGWTSGATLSAADQQRCVEARAALDADAAAPCSAE